MSEFAFFVCAIGAYLSARRVLDLGFSIVHVAAGASCLLMAIQFMMLGIDFWPL